MRNSNNEAMLVADEARPPAESESTIEQEDLLALLLGESEEVSRIEGVVVGALVGFAASGEPLVDFYRNPAGEPFAARSTVALSAQNINCDVALLFEQGDPRKPIVLGLMWHPEAPSVAPASSALEPIEVTTDGKRMTLTAEREIVLRCGKASITLTRAGKILLRGKYVLSRSSGVNRIKGGSVQIN